MIRPTSNAILPTARGPDSVQFVVKQPNTKLSIEFDDLWRRHTLFIFADPLETEVPPMFPSDGTRVIYLPPGEHQRIIKPQSDTTYYLAGGAFLSHPADATDSSLFYSSRSNKNTHITIRGRGVVSGKFSTGSPYLVSLCGIGHRIEGVIWIEPPQQSILEINAPWSCECGWSCSLPEQTTIENVKLLGWNYADGIHAGSQSHVSHCFVRVNDDGVKPFLSDALFEDLVIWQQHNGWAVMLAWLTEGIQSNITVRNVTILHDDHDHDYPVSGCDPCVPNQATIGAVQGGSGEVSHVLIDNLVAETPVWRPFWFGMDKNTWGPTGGGRLAHWTIQGVHMAGGAYNSTILGAKASAKNGSHCSIDGLHFHGYKLAGHMVTSPAAAHVSIGRDACGVDFAADFAATQS